MVIGLTCLCKLVNFLFKIPPNSFIQVLNQTSLSTFCPEITLYYISFLEKENVSPNLVFYVSSNSMFSLKLLVGESKDPVVEMS